LSPENIVINPYPHSLQEITPCNNDPGLAFLRDRDLLKDRKNNGVKASWPIYPLTVNGGGPGSENHSPEFELKILILYHTT
jgi:hypothetical protein